MFVQIDALPSIYWRPLLSRSSAPRPSTNTSGSCPGEHHWRISVNGCQIKRLSHSISFSVFQSLMAIPCGFCPVFPLVNELFDCGNVLDCGAPPVIFADKDFSQGHQIFQQRITMMRPLQLARGFGLEPPRAAKFRSPHLAFPSVRLFLSPYVLTPHGRGTLLSEIERCS